eukprot:7383523-Prymnesium_polylepis.1
MAQRARRFASAAVDGSLTGLFSGFLASLEPPVTADNTPPPASPRPPPTIEQRAKQSRYWAAHNEPA